MFFKIFFSHIANTNKTTSFFIYSDAFWFFVFFDILIKPYGYTYSFYLINISI